MEYVRARNNEGEHKDNDEQIMQRLKKLSVQSSEDSLDCTAPE